MARVYRVAVIGLGVIGRRMLANMPNQGRLEVIGGWDLSAKARVAAAADFLWLTVDELVKLSDGGPHLLPDLRTALGVQELIEAILAAG